MGRDCSSDYFSFARGLIACDIVVAACVSKAALLRNAVLLSFATTCRSSLLMVPPTGVYLKLIWCGNFDNAAVYLPTLGQ